MKVLWFNGRTIHTVTLPKIDIATETKDFQKLVGGYFEIVPISDDAVMLVDEDGLNKCLTPNPAASMFAGQAIVGPAVVVGVDQNADGELFFTDYPKRFGIFKEVSHDFSGT